VGVRLCAAIPAKRTPLSIAREQPVVGAARIAHHQPVRIRIAHQVIQIDAVGAQQLVDQREREQPVGAGPDPDPFVGDRAVAAAHRVHRHDLGAARLEPAQAELDRVGIVVLGHAPEHEVARVLPVGFAELPEAAAERVQAAGGHVDRAEAAMRGIVDGTELLRPPAGQRLRLVAAGEEGQLVRVARADRRQPRGGDLERFVPADLAELAAAALAHPQQRPRQPRRRVVLHDPGRALGAEHAAIDRVLGIALDVADPSVRQPNLDAAAARAHVARGRLDLVSGRGRQVEGGLGHGALRRRARAA
jgi:hypothetical protein